MTHVADLAACPIDYVDVFAPHPLAGNPLAVIRVGIMPSQALRQDCARETNLSETTFLATQADASGAWPVCIHTPDSELPFAGHPVLGTAWVVREHLLAGAEDVVVLATGMGAVPVRFEGRGAGARAWLRAPEVGIETLTDAGTAIATVLGLSPEQLDATLLPPALVDVGPRFLVLALSERARLASLIPDAVALTALLQAHDATGVLAVAQAGEGEGDLAARMFFEAGGVREDPATGSANAGLAAVLRSVGRSGRVEVTQGVEMLRPSRISLVISDDVIEVGGAVWPFVSGRLC